MQPPVTPGDRAAAATGRRRLLQAARPWRSPSSPRRAREAPRPLLQVRRWRRSRGVRPGDPARRSVWAASWSTMRRAISRLLSDW